MPMSSLVALGFRCLVSGVLLTASARAASPAPAWSPLPRLTDVRHERAAVVTADVIARGSVTVDLPFRVNAQGRPSRRMLVGPGWLRFETAPPRTVSLDGELEASLADGGTLLQADVLAGDDIGIGPLTKILVTTEPDAVAVRWVALATPLGPATVEALVDRAGRLTIQHLSVPANVAALRARSGLPGAPLRPQSATSQRAPLGPVAILDPPRGPTLPMHPGLPPEGCIPEASTWCERADGPGTSEVWLSEGFDDLMATSRGWTASGDWHPVPYATCPPGASFDPGGSMYFGVDGACTYLPSTAGSLFSAPFGPITAGSQFVFTSRFGYDTGTDTAQVYVNGTLIGNMPAGLDPALWYNFNPIDLSPWAGAIAKIEFRFAASRAREDLGWFIDDVVAWSPLVGNPDCIRNAGHGSAAHCDDREATRWTFNESRFCTGCTYTFYVLVECGREMHLPLDDMEGADVQVTNVVDPTAPPPLRCVNLTARADAGLGPYPGFFVGDAALVPLDCCAPAGPEVWYGPPMDVTDSAGPGRVAWGLADGCPIFTVYDLDADGTECSELPATCGGLLSRVSPGDVQVVDCYIEDTSGLCGLYRVDVTSGGNVWSLFANCDGTNTPEFPIFFDCTEAWAAFNPLPELSVTNLIVTGACPDLTVDFDVVNVGCQEHPGDVVARIEAAGADPSCVDPPVVIDHVVTGPLAPGAVVHVTRTITAPCMPARVSVSIDPDNLVPECTEVPTAAACRADVGVNVLTSFTCGCAAQLIAEAGADEGACVGEIVRLDGSASTIDPCASPLYRWLDETGAVVRDWTASPTHDVAVRCPAGRTYTLEISCAGESCTDSDEVTVSCISITPAAGPDARACVGDPITLDASASVVTSCATPIYRYFDGAGLEVRGWSPDPVFVLPFLDCAAAGDWLVEVGCQGETCTYYDFVTVDCVEVLANAGPDLVACEAVPVDIRGASSTSRGCTSVVYQWFDAALNPVSGVLTDPDFSVAWAGCPGFPQLVLVAACADPGFEDCGTFDVVTFECGNPALPVPVATPQCGGVQVACGAAEPGVTYWWDADIAVDSDLDGDATNDRDLPACDGNLIYANGATMTARAWAQDALGCRSLADVDVTPLPAPTTPVPSAEPACAGQDSLLRCGSTEAMIAWDFDVATDSDGNTVPDDDVDATACDASAPYPAGDTTARVTATAAGGCSSSATLIVTVATPVAPPEVHDDHAGRLGNAIWLRWDATPGAVGYRVSRGAIGTWYDHAAGAPAGGICDTGNVTNWSDPDDAVDGSDWYYLIAALEPCGLEGPPGDGTDGVAPFPRDPRIPTAGCP